MGKKEKKIRELEKQVDWLEFEIKYVSKENRALRDTQEQVATIVTQGLNWTQREMNTVLNDLNRKIADLEHINEDFEMALKIAQKKQDKENERWNTNHIPRVISHISKNMTAGAPILYLNRRPLKSGNSINNNDANIMIDSGVC